MHVVILSAEYPPFFIGGVGSFVKNLAAGLGKEGVKVTVISGYPSFSRAKLFDVIEEKFPNINIIRYPYLNIHPKNAIFQLLNLKRLYETIKKINPDVIHGQGASTFPASIKLKKLAPLIVTFHSSPKINKTMGVYSILRGGSFYDFKINVLGYPVSSFIYKKEIRDSEVAVAVSRILALELMEETSEAYKEKIYKIHNCIDIETLDKEYNSCNLKEMNDAILFAGRMIWIKGTLLLIRLARLLQREKIGLKLIIHGNGPLSKTVARKIQNYRLTNVELKGFSRGEQFISSLKRSGFVIIPSYYEACPMILLESMCLGKIPVMFNLPFANEFTENGKYAILANNVSEMAEKLKVAYLKSDLKNFSNRIRSFARKKYDIKNMVSKYLVLYRKISRN